MVYSVYNRELPSYSCTISSMGFGSNHTSDWLLPTFPTIQAFLFHGGGLSCWQNKLQTINREFFFAYTTRGGFANVCTREWAEPPRCPSGCVAASLSGPLKGGHSRTGARIGFNLVSRGAESGMQCLAIRLRTPIRMLNPSFLIVQI